MGAAEPVAFNDCAARGRAMDTDELANFARAELTKIVAELGEREG